VRFEVVVGEKVVDGLSDVMSQLLHEVHAHLSLQSW